MDDPVHSNIGLFWHDSGFAFLGCRADADVILRYTCTLRFGVVSVRQTSFQSIINVLSFGMFVAIMDESILTYLSVSR